MIVDVLIDGEPRRIELRERRAGTPIDVQARIIRLYARGHSLAEVGRLTWVDKSTVWLLLKTYGIPRHTHGGSRQRLTTEDLLKVGELYARGMCAAEIAPLVGLKSESSVRRRLEKLDGVKRTKSEAGRLMHQRGRHPRSRSKAFGAQGGSSPAASAERAAGAAQ